MIKKLSHFIDGQKVGGSNDRFADIFNPATGEIILQVPLAGQEDVKSAVRSALNALPGWMATPLAKRAQVMFNFRELLKKNIDHLAKLVSREHGKTLEDAKGSVTVQPVRHAAGQ